MNFIRGFDHPYQVEEISYDGGIWNTTYHFRMLKTSTNAIKGETEDA